MRKKTYRILMFILISSVFVAFKLAEDPIDSLLKKLNVYNQQNPQEKVYLHLDKPYYAIGDHIWFKAYVTETRSNQPSTISSALYVELLNETDSITRQIKLPLVSGVSWGDFTLADTLAEGNYRIRAYTQWMRNAGPDFFFDKTIKIGNAWANNVFTSTSYTFVKRNNSNFVEAVIKFTDKTRKPYIGQLVSYDVQLKDKAAGRGKATTNAQGEISLSFQNSTGLEASGKITATLNMGAKQEVVKIIPVKATSDQLSVQFFPEGGGLVENLPSKIGIKAVNSSGLGEDISGIISDQNGNEVLKFQTTHLGMGHLSLSPQPGIQYTANVKRKDGSSIAIPLPKAEPSGYVLNVNNSDSNKVIVRVLISPLLVNKGNLKLVVQQNNTVIAVQSVETTKQLNLLTVPKKELPSGIIHFTLFKPDGLALAERLVFIRNPADQTDAKLLSLKSVYNRRENVPLELSAITAGKTGTGTYSIAVTNSSVVQADPDNESNILTTLLLTSDLKGYVEKPNYYLRNNTPESREHLDNLLLSQGWSRLLWTDLKNNPIKPPEFPAEQSLEVSGRITTSGGKAVPNGRVSLLSTDGGFFMIDTLTNANGEFRFNNLAFNEGTRFVVQARNAKNKKYVEINLNKIPGQVYTKNKNTGDVEINVNEAIQAYILKSNSYFEGLNKQGLLERTLMLNQVDILQKKNPAKNSSNLNGAGNADFIMTAKDLGTCITLSQCLQGRVAGLMIQNGKAFMLRNNGIPMQIVLDGMFMEADFMDNIPPIDVESIEILKNVSNTSLYGIRGGGGLIIITTKRGGGDLSYTRYSPGIITYAPKGYYVQRQFYSPQYLPANTDKTEDKRTTVYWNPTLITAADGKTKFNFYNTDEAGTYRIVLEGINGEGNLARKVYTYEVK